MRTCSRSARPVLMVGAGLLLLAACGSGGGGSSTSSGGASPSGTGSVAARSTSAGTVLVDPAGMTLYAFANDSKGHSTCSGSCATYWPPVPGADAPQGSTSSVTARFGTIKRPDGSSQLTVNGFPMYTYAGDSAPGQANGQGKDLSGGLWWVVAPNGSWVEGSGASSGAGGGY